MPARELETRAAHSEGALFFEKRIRSGIWQATPHSLKRKVGVATELAVLLDGAITIVSDEGVPTTVKAGNVCVVASSEYKWIQQTKVRKY